MPDRIDPPTAGIQELYEAMWLRHINPGDYAAQPVPLPLLVEMENAAAEEHGWLRILHPREQKAILRATVRGGELASRDMQLMTLSTDDDRPLDWLRAGQALQHALLTGTRYSMSSGTGRGERYRSSLKYRLSDFHPLHPPDRVPSSYGVTASFLTQSLEREDQQRDSAALAVADVLQRGAAGGAAGRFLAGGAGSRAAALRGRADGNGVTAGPFGIALCAELLISF